MTKENDSILLSAFDERWKKFRAQHKACRMEFTDEAVHDLRVGHKKIPELMCKDNENQVEYNL